MHTYYDAKEMLHKELGDIVKKGELSAGSLDTIDKLLNSIKNACKIIMYEEYSDDGYSYSDTPRDSRGRYSYHDGYSRRNRTMYSRHGDDKDKKIEILRDMMQEVSSDEERRALQKIIRRMEQE